MTFKIDLNASNVIPIYTSANTTLLLQVFRYDSCSIYSPTASHDSKQVHARMNYHGKKEVFSDVAILVIDKDSEDTTAEWYAQVRMLFSCQDLQRQRHELAFVRWYEVAGLAPRPFQDSTYLRFAQGHSNSDRGQITQPPAGPECYGIVDIHLIDRIVLIQKDHHAAGRFFLNRYLRVH